MRWLLNEDGFGKIYSSQTGMLFAHEQGPRRRAWDEEWPWMAESTPIWEKSLLSTTTKKYNFNDLCIQNQAEVQRLQKMLVPTTNSPNSSSRSHSSGPATVLAPELDLRQYITNIFRRQRKPH